MDWAHIKCEGVTVRLYETLDENERELWFCEECKSIVKDSIEKNRKTGRKNKGKREGDEN